MKKDYLRCVKCRRLIVNSNGKYVVKGDMTANYHGFSWVTFGQKAGYGFYHNECLHPPTLWQRLKRIF